MIRFACVVLFLASSAFADPPEPQKNILVVLPVGEPLGKSTQDFAQLGEDASEAMSFDLQKEFGLTFAPKEDSYARLGYTGPKRDQVGNCIYTLACPRELRRSRNAEWIIIVRLTYEMTSGYKFQIINIGATDQDDVVTSGTAPDGTKELFDALSHKLHENVQQALTTRQTVALTITTNVSGAAVTVDEKPVTLDQSSTIRVRPGQVKVTIAKIGYTTATGSVSCYVGEKCAIALPLTVAPIKPPELPPIEVSEPVTGKPFWIAGYSALGAGAVTLVTWLAIRQKALDLSDEVSHTCDTTPCSMPYDEALGKHNDAESNAKIANALGWTGLSLAIVGVGLATYGHIRDYQLDHKAELVTPSTNKPVTLHVAPILGPDTYGASAMLAF